MLSINFATSRNIIILQEWIISMISTRLDSTALDLLLNLKKPGSRSSKPRRRAFARRAFRGQIRIRWLFESFKRKRKAAKAALLLLNYPTTLNYPSLRQSQHTLPPAPKADGVSRKLEDLSRYLSGREYLLSKRNAITGNSSSLLKDKLHIVQIYITNETKFKALHCLP